MVLRKNSYFFTVAACAVWNNVNNSLGQIWYGRIQDEKNADFFSTKELRIEEGLIQRSVRHDFA